MLIPLSASLLSQADPEVEQTYSRARHLCEHLDDPHQLFPVLGGLYTYYNALAEYQTAHTLGEQLLALAQQTQNPAMLVMAHRALGTTLLLLGAVASAHTHLEQGIALHDPQQHRVSMYGYGEDANVACRNHAARALWYLGYPDQGLAQKQEAVTLAQQMAHPYSLCLALQGAAMFHQVRREVRAAQECAEAVITLATDQGLPYWMAISSILCGWARVHQGQTREGIEQLTQGLRAFRAMGSKMNQSYFLALLAEAHGTIGKPEEGLAALAEALTLADSTGERWYEAELHRLKGILLLQQSSDNHAEAENCFHHALEIARNQQAKSFELRTAMSLARLWQQQGKRQEAYDLLAPIYNWFTEGFDTADLKDAKALLDELAEERS